MAAHTRFHTSHFHISDEKKRNDFSSHEKIDENEYDRMQREDRRKKRIDLVDLQLCGTRYKRDTCEGGTALM
jgi:hypothetical protein